MEDHTTHAPTNEIPYGFCHCGCGQKTTIAKQTERKRGSIRGEPIRYVFGHQFGRVVQTTTGNTTGLCLCGCGQPTPIAKGTNKKRGWVKGQHLDYILNHYKKTRAPLPIYPEGVYAPWVAQHGLQHPYGKCQCGCGQDAYIANQDRPKRGWLKGAPVRFAGGHNMRKADIDQFWQSVPERDPNKCWIWQGPMHPTGYGRAHWQGKVIVASRVSYMIHYGPIPKGLLVCHNCPDGDDSRCVNPTHLFAGTQNDNMQDMITKGRKARGEKSGVNKLTEAQVIEIRQRHNQGGITQNQLAIEYGVFNTNISMIVRRKTWRHLP